MPSQSEAFFEQYAQTLNSKNAGEIARYHMLPSVFVIDETKKIFHAYKDVENEIQAFINALDERGCTEHVPQVNQAIRLSDKILFSNVRWQYKNEEGEVLCTTHCSYTLQQVNDSELKIIVEVIDDEDKVITSKMLED